MSNRIMDRVKEWEREARNSFGNDISTSTGRFWAHVHFHLFDHAYLRGVWTNFYQIAPQVYRSNQPSPRRLRRLGQLGITQIINLRGEEPHPHFLFEAEACDRYGLTLQSIKMDARRAPTRERIQELLALFDTLERPFLMHCKSGADRAGFASAVYLLHVQGAPVSKALRQMSVRHMHVDFTRTGVLDYILNVFAARQNFGRILFADWIATEYDHNVLQKSFDTRQAWDVTAQGLVKSPVV